MALNELKLPIITHPDIENSYVKLNSADTLLTNFHTSRLLSLTGDSLTSSIYGTTAHTTASTSGYFKVSQMHMYNLGFLNSYTALANNTFGIYSLKKRFFDEAIKSGTLTASVSSATLGGDYYDSGSGQLIRKQTSTTVGAVLNDLGMFVVTASEIANIVDSITSLQYKAEVGNTTLHVFCKCQPNELNFSYNPTSFATAGMSSYMDSPVTAFTNSAKYYSDLVSSGSNNFPHITNVGLYNDKNELLAVAKMARPLRKPSDLPLTFRISLDL